MTTLWRHRKNKHEEAWTERIHRRLEWEKKITIKHDDDKIRYVRYQIPKSFDDGHWDLEVE